MIRCPGKSLLSSTFSDSNGTTVEKKGNKELFDESANNDGEATIEDDELLNFDSNDILLNTVADSLADAVKTEL